MRRGETLTITEGGRPVTTVTPAAVSRTKYSDEGFRAITAGFDAFAPRHTVDGISWKDRRDDGRR